MGLSGLFVDLNNRKSPTPSDNKGSMTEKAKGRPGFEPGLVGQKSDTLPLALPPLPNFRAVLRSRSLLGLSSTSWKIDGRSKPPSKAHLRSSVESKEASQKDAASEGSKRNRVTRNFIDAAVLIEPALPGTDDVAADLSVWQLKLKFKILG